MEAVSPAMRRLSSEASSTMNGYGNEMWCGPPNFQMPLHYPRYTRADYEAMPEWKLDRLFADYGLPIAGDVAQKRRFAVGSFIWPN